MDTGLLANSTATSYVGPSEKKEEKEKEEEIKVGEQITARITDNPRVIIQSGIISNKR